MTPVEWVGLGLTSAALFMALLAWGFWRPLGILWCLWFFVKGVALSVLGVMVATGRILRPDEQLLVVTGLLLGLVLWHSVMIALTPLSK
ncbi:MAG: hypothetical protein CL878_15070 [Dehalococcoidia bacterium]|nr:hypothetical protein [Dehalococcoidia bacterium]